MRLSDCPFPLQISCPTVEGCPGDDIVSRTFGLNRAKRDGPELSLEQIRAALAANPLLQRQIALAAPNSPASPPGQREQQHAASSNSAPLRMNTGRKGEREGMGKNWTFSEINIYGMNVLSLPLPLYYFIYRTVLSILTFFAPSALQQQLIMLGGDTLVRRRLVVVNSEEELRYYIKTGEVPKAADGRR